MEKKPPFGLGFNWGTPVDPCDRTPNTRPVSDSRRAVFLSYSSQDSRAAMVAAVRGRNPPGIRPARTSIAVGSRSISLAGVVSRPGGPRPGASSSNDLPSIAVLPFVNMSRHEENEFFADGLSEELLNVLAKIRGLRVASRTSAFFFKGKNIDLATVAQKLNVATILEGSVRKSGKRVRITAQRATRSRARPHGHRSALSLLARRSALAPLSEEDGVRVTQGQVH